jgi:hypothetical protein
MKFLVVSHRGSAPIPADQRAENERQWGLWMGRLNEQVGLRAKVGKTVSSDGIGVYLGDSAGVSIIDAPSLDEAVERVKACPGLPYGWAFDVLSE